MNSTLPHLQPNAKTIYLAPIRSDSPSSLSLGICRSRARQIPRGFTLVEIAIAVFIITLLLGSILVPLTTQVENRNFDNTQRILDQAREALLGFAAANGYFPCPASATSNGQEAVGFNHSTGAATTCPATVGIAGVNNIYYGFLPAATLGFTPVDANGFAVDAWGLSPYSRIRYAVSAVTINAITQPFTRVNGMRNAGMSNISSATTLLYVCNSGTGVTATNCNTAVALASSVPIVIWSVGPNAATTSGASVDEAQNPNPAGGSADRIFVSKTRSTVAGSAFDDIVTWVGAATIFNRLIAAGQLP
jgi:prepilin-type N-terminal cleavage/methylation domain-containing protein